MLIIKIVTIGKIDKAYWENAAKDFEQRIKKYAHLETISLTEVKNANVKVKVIQESQLISALIKKYSKYQIFLLDQTGLKLTSEEFANIINDSQTYRQSKIMFIIGGSNGVSSELRSEKNITKIAFGYLTLPHQLCYVVLLEQIYRGFQIIHNQPYHK